jgi:hypothetical protein
MNVDELIQSAERSLTLINHDLQIQRLLLRNGGGLLDTNTDGSSVFAVLLKTPTKTTPRSLQLAFEANEVGESIASILESLIGPLFPFVICPYLDTDNIRNSDLALTDHFSIREWLRSPEYNQYTLEKLVKFLAEQSERKCKSFDFSFINIDEIQNILEYAGLLQLWYDYIGTCLDVNSSQEIGIWRLISHLRPRYATLNLVFVRLAEIATCSDHNSLLLRSVICMTLDRFLSRFDSMDDKEEEEEKDREELFFALITVLAQIIMQNSSSLHSKWPPVSLYNAQANYLICCYG